MKRIRTRDWRTEIDVTLMATTERGAIDWINRKRRALRQRERSARRFWLRLPGLGRGSR